MQHTPLLEPRTYFGTLVFPPQTGFYKFSKRVTLTNILDVLRAAPEQRVWISNHAPDFTYWRDEFRPQYHLYVKRSISTNKLLLAQLIFTFVEPSHYPVGDEANWLR